MTVVKSCQTVGTMVAILSLGIGCGRSHMQAAGHLASLESRSHFEVYQGVNSNDPSQSCTFSIERDAARNVQEMKLTSGYYQFIVTTRVTEEVARATWERLSFTRQPSVRYPGYTRVGYMLAGPSLWGLTQLPLVAAFFELFSSGEVFVVAKDDFSKVIAERTGVPLGRTGPRVAVASVACEQMHRVPPNDAT